MSENTIIATLDKSKWGEGPWQSEPDRIEWKSAAGRPCLMSRGRGGHWCGYVAVDPGHPWHGKGYNDVQTADGEYPDVHGGLTYADKCSGTICHVPAPGEQDDVWWFGFDCAHSGDLSPKWTESGRRQSDELGNIYRDAAYVRAECESLARQIVAVQP